MKNKKLIIILLSIFIISIVVFNYHKSTDNITIDNVSLNNLDNNKSKLFAIMISENNGSDYHECSNEICNNSSFPNSAYIYQKAECLDDRGETADAVVTYQNNQATVKSNKTVYCTLYFNKDTTKPIITNFYIKENTIQPKYSNASNKQETATVTWNDEDVLSYCIINTNNVTNCDSNSNWKDANSKTGTLQLTLSEGSNTYYAFLKDIAGNTSALENNQASKSDTIILDITAPLVNKTSTKAGDITETSANITVVVDDTKGVNVTTTSGINEYCYGTNDTNVTSDYTCKNYTANVKISLTELKEGTSYTYYIYATDNAGNSSIGNRIPITFMTASKPANEKVIDNATGQIQSSPVEGDTLRRFQGSASNVKNNYICFGTSDKTTCTGTPGTYMYRIMGIDTATNQLKIIKKEALETVYKWNSGTGIYNTWGVSDIQKGLNGEYFLTNTTYVPTTNIQNTNTTWSNAIENHTWNYGDVPYSSAGVGDSTNATQILANEQTAWAGGSDYPYYAGTIDAKISLMYVSDYYLAVSDTAKCRNNADECAASWISIKNNDTSAPGDGSEWTMTRLNYGNAWYVVLSGHVEDFGWMYEESHTARPVFYLIPNIKLDGDGSIGNPYRITGLAS